ncbi:GNAT family N-acetyltransferase [Nocardioides sp. Root140]|uniref:GNAT family N-acetyltransferase n=1 Tax=Nocardioides sp. Root140 TaxID=1736460 RepID=UPI0006F2EDA3|nr:GNAT family N-acetyltransferase [Nocardioides sp. Root140]KQY64740.1 hypothetical protein ASD30_07565 [Nocardioides sp. Root140]
MTELRRPALLDGKHDRTFLDSGATSLDHWLRHQAGQSDRGNTARTWVLADSEYRVVGYVAMSMTGVVLDQAPKKLQSGRLDPIPALLCGRLAVDQRHRGLGLGTMLVRLLLTKATEANRTAACRAVVVHALDSEAKAFWERFGFHPFTAGAEERDLFMLTSEIEATLSRLLA